MALQKLIIVILQTWQSKSNDFNVITVFSVVIHVVKFIYLQTNSSEGVKDDVV